MSEPDRSAATPITPVQAALIDAGFRPSRQAWAVRLARRLIWPLIRPFHFYTLERTQLAGDKLDRLEQDFREFDSWPTLSARLRLLESALGELGRAVGLVENAIAHSRLDRMEIRLDALEFSVGKLVAHAEASRDEPASRRDVALLESAVARMRSELVAMANRQVWTEDRLSYAAEGTPTLQASPGNLPAAQIAPGTDSPDRPEGRS